MYRAERKRNACMRKPSDRPSEPLSGQARATIAACEPRSQRTFTPSLAEIAKSAGIFHWTADGRRLYDFTSGVLVANLGHNPPHWQERFRKHMADLSLTAYNALTPIEVEASSRLIALLQSRPGGEALQQVLWASSGSEAI